MTTGPKTLTLNWSGVPSLPATAVPWAMPMPQAKPSRGWPGRCAARREIAADGQGGAGRLLDLVAAVQRPAPEAHRGVALKIADHPVLVDDVVGHDAQGFADAVARRHQVVLGSLGDAAGAAQVAEQDGDLGFTRLQDLGHVGIGDQRRQDGTRQEAGQRRLPALQFAHLAQGAEDVGDEFGKLQIALVQFGIGRDLRLGQRRRKVAGDIKAPAGERVVGKRHGDGPVDTGTLGEVTPGLGGRPAVQHTLSPPANGVKDQSAAWLKIAAAVDAPHGTAHLDLRIGRACRRVQPHDRRRVRAGMPRNRTSTTRLSNSSLLGE